LSGRLRALPTRSALLAVLVLASSALLAFPARASARAVPPLAGPVVDEAGILAARDRERLGSLCRAAWGLPEGQRVQLQYLILGSLEGEDIEGFSSRAFEAYKLGDRSKDNGVLLVVSRDDHRVRIETGYGTEGALTDVQANRIIRNTLAPAFRVGRYGDGLYDAGVEILSALDALPKGTSRTVVRGEGRAGISIVFVLIFLVFIAVRLFTGFGPRRRFFGGGFGGPFGGGLGGGGWGLGGGGGGLGGGGWGGGGGRSGGGGASGGW
jgi:uncharacterized protein